MSLYVFLNSRKKPVAIRDLRNHEEVQARNDISSYIAQQNFYSTRRAYGASSTKVSKIKNAVMLAQSGIISYRNLFG